jgi:hypothetical protein
VCCAYIEPSRDLLFCAASQRTTLKHAARTGAGRDAAVHVFFDRVATRGALGPNIQTRGTTLACVPRSSSTVRGNSIHEPGRA